MNQEAIAAIISASIAGLVALLVAYMITRKK